MQTYKKIEIPPKKAVLVFIVYKTNKPNIDKVIAIISADWNDILPDGKGLFLVRSINASKSFSMIWLKALEAPTVKYPPKANRIISIKRGTSAANKYPVIDEKTTLNANRTFVNCLKSSKKSEKEDRLEMSIWILSTFILIGKDNVE